MPFLTTIWFWPPGGGLDDPDEDAFVRTAGRVGEAYSRAIAEQRIAARHREIRCFVHHDPVVTTVQVHVHHDLPEEGFMGARVDLPTGIAALTPSARAALVLNVFATILVGLAQQYHWNTGALARARAQAATRDGDFEADTAWIASPGRNWQARSRYRLDDQGQGWVCLEAATRGGDQQTWRSAELISAPHVAGFLKRTGLRWTARDIVELSTQSAIDGRQQKLTLNPSTDAAVSNAAMDRRNAPLGEVSAPEAELIIHGAPTSAPEAMLGSGGPTNDVPAAYLRTVEWLSNWIEENLLQWWSQAGPRSWYGDWDYEPRRTGAPMVRLTGHRLTTRVRHRMPDPEAEADPIGSAYRHTAQLVAAVQRRLDLADPEPPLPPLEELRTKIKSHAHSPSDSAGAQVHDSGRE